MDKFGIFKLLNSFLQKNSKSNDEKNANEDNLANTITNIFSSLGGEKKNGFSSQKGETPIKKQVETRPLQAGMLATMNSHDAFVKRVKEKNLSK